MDNYKMVEFEIFSVIYNYNYSFLFSIILHYYAKVNILAEIVLFRILWSDFETLYYNCILVSKA